MNKNIDVSSVTLKTGRLVLRPWRETDLADFYEYARVDGVGQMAGWLPHGSVEFSRGILSGFIEGKKVLALEYAGKAVGSLGIEEYKEREFPELAALQGREIGYVLSKDHWGRGLMPEAVNAVLEWLFLDQQLDFVTVGHFVWNRQSRRVIEKCGFRFVKEVKHETRYEKVEDCLVYILTKEEWMKQR